MHGPHTDFPPSIMSPGNYMHGYSKSVLASHQWRTVQNSAGYLLPFLNKTQHLLDLGSGAGTITCDFTELVGRVTALELNDKALDITREEAKRRNVELEYAIGDAHALPFEDNTFDVVHTHKVLQHLEDPAQALKEMRRVVKPGGIVGSCDSDYAVFTWFPDNPMLEEWRKLYIDIARSDGGEPNAGRMLLDWALRAGFTDITPGATAWCFATPETRDYWGGMWAKRILNSSIADQARERGVSQQALQDISDGWTRWKDSKNGWFMVPQGTIVARK